MTGKPTAAFKIVIKGSGGSVAVIDINTKEKDIGAAFKAANHIRDTMAEHCANDLKVSVVRENNSEE